MSSELHLCEHPDCEHPDTTPCIVVAYRRDFPARWYVSVYGLRVGAGLLWRLWRHGRVELPPEWYCAEHAKIHGYCWGCGFQWAGCENFDFDRGIFCPNCRKWLDDYDTDFHDDEWLDMWEHCPGELLAGDVAFAG